MNNLAKSQELDIIQKNQENITCIFSTIQTTIYFILNKWKRPGNNFIFNHFLWKCKLLITSYPAIIFPVYLFFNLSILYLTYCKIGNECFRYNLFNSFLAATKLWMRAGMISSANVESFFDVNRIRVLHIAKLPFCLRVSLFILSWQPQI